MSFLCSMALIPRPCINLDDDSDEETERLPDITVEENYFVRLLWQKLFRTLTLAEMRNMSRIKPEYLITLLRFHTH